MVNRGQGYPFIRYTSSSIGIRCSHPIRSTALNPSPSSSRHPHHHKPPIQNSDHPASFSTNLQSPPKQTVITPAGKASILNHWSSKDQAHENATFHGRRQKRMYNLCSFLWRCTRRCTLRLARRCQPLNRTLGRFRLQMPVELDRPATVGKRMTRPRLKLSKHDLKIISNTEEVLVPIRLEIELEHCKLRDTFTGNLKEPVVTPEQFAIHLCEDLILPIQHFSGPIVSAIREQSEEYELHENL
ncbi:SWI/SNF chromatin-remodeling complex subunit [Puccinia graminis f. sp. tritici]|uniref:SWI/SNF chromatin-remodeling complex subunit n=1 Tax=Puccinia graminis f. sp. tritici TaxID=56615 RepID=A0A5B0RRV9_PUCGR|nr:SWI/SNF chromatin-remodeling complex subunit [Puccinia graminis f. sp. tritici]